jgi:DNA polymerase
MQKIEEGVDLYCDFGSRHFGRPITKADKRERQIAKVAILGLGYSMGAKRFKETVFEWTGEAITEAEAQKTVDTYRSLYELNKKFWWRLDSEAKSAIKNRCRVGNFFTGANEDTLHYQLPSGRVLTYWRPRIIEGMYGEQVQYDRPKDGKMHATHSYGGKWTENICQAISRDLLVEAMMELEGETTLLSTVHDEIIAESVKPELDLERMVAKMEANPSWATGLPLNVEGFISKEFKK